MSDCLFCKIIHGEIPSIKVYEDDKVVAFLDISQATPGHTLVIPKHHVANIFEYDNEIAIDVATRLPIIARAISKAFPDSQGLNIVSNNGEMAYQTVFHSHWHLIPRYHEEEGFSMQFVNNQSNYSEDDFAQRAQQIRQQLEGAKL